MNSASILATAFPKICLRRFSTTEFRCKKPDLTNLKKKQEWFQQDNGVPVYLKGGPSDHVLYYITVALTMIGLGSAIHSTYRLAVTK